MKHLIFAYGSLVNKESRKKTSSNFGKEIVANLVGYKRGWYFKTEKSKTTSVGIIKSENNSVNGVLFEVDDRGLELFDKRESGYKRIELDKREINLNNYDIGEKIIWTYVVDNIDLPNENFPIVQSYIDIIIKGYLDISESFVNEFIETTYGWEYYWVNDRDDSKFKIQIENSKIDIFDDLIYKNLNKKI